MGMEEQWEEKEGERRRRSRKRSRRRSTKFHPAGDWKGPNTSGSPQEGLFFVKSGVCRFENRDPNILVGH